jgi:diguanylate cyclase (GGDEF)-like protein
VTRRAAVLVALAAAWLLPAWSPASARPASPPHVTTAATRAEIPTAAAGAPLPLEAPSPAAASLLQPAAIHGTFRVPPAGTALYIGTPWYVRDLTATITGPGPRRITILATADLPGHMLGLRLPNDAWQADRIDVDATTVSTAAPPYLLPAEQLALIGWRNWSFAAYFGLFIALALLGAALALTRRSGTAAWYAAAAAAQAGLLIPWLGTVRPPPEISQPLHAAFQSLFFVALAAFGLALLRGVRLPRTATAALWSLVALNAAAVTAGDVLQDFYPLPDIATQTIVAAVDIAYVALGSAAVRAHAPGARFLLTGTTIAALGFLAGNAFATPFLQSAPIATLAAEALLLALALAAHLQPRPSAETNATTAPEPARALRPAEIDGLTEIANRPALDDRLTAAWSHASSTRTPLAALLVDIDHFRRYNDAYGHLAGDDVLRRIAAALTATAARGDDVTGRYAGDKFLTVLPDTDLAGARHIADTVRAAVVALELAHGDAPAKRVTVSIGVTSVIPPPGPPPPTPTTDKDTLAPPATETDPADLLHRAATALRIAKAMGRNRVVADEPIAPPVAFR